MYTTEFASINPNSIQTGGVQTWSLPGRSERQREGRSQRAAATLKSQFVPKSNSIDPEPEGSEERRDHVRVPARTGEQLVVERRLDPALVHGHDRPIRTATVCRATRVATTAYSATASSTDPGPDHIRGTGDDRITHLLRRRCPRTSARTRSSTPTAATTCRSTARSGTRRSRLSISKRMSNRWQMQGSYVWSRLDGANWAHDERHRPRGYDYTNPNNRSTSSGRAAARTTSRTPSSCSAATRRRGASTSARTYQALSGLPIDRTLTVALAQGSRAIPVEPRGTYRADSAQPALAPRRQGRSGSAAATAPRSWWSCTTCSTRAPARAATAR